MDSPLSISELSLLESTLLPALERHHLRLLAHGLRTLQAVAARRDGDPPDHREIVEWALAQPAIAEDPSFARALAAQLFSAGQQLRSIAKGYDREPLALELEELIRWARAQADARLR